MSSESRTVARTAADPGLAAEVKRLGTSSLLYFAVMMFARGLNVLMVPVYTRAMSPEDYGIVGLAASVTQVAAVFLGLALPASLNRFHFEFDTDQERRRFTSTVVLFLCVWPVAVAALLHGIGSLGYLELFKTVPFEPYLRLALWCGVVGLFPSIFLNLHVAREQPRRVALFNGGLVLVTIALNVVFVVALRQGAVGQLRATLISGVAMAVVCGVLVLRLTGLSFSLRHLRSALGYSLPLVPHLLSNWLLFWSDRAILERYVSQGELGRYTLAYTFASVPVVAAAAMNTAFSPVVQRYIKAGRRDDAVKLGTYVLLPTIATSLLIAVTADAAVQVVTVPAFSGAASVIPWLALGAACQAVGGVWALGLHITRKTSYVPLVTGVAAAANIALNFVFVPRYGILAAAINTAVGYALTAVLFALASRRASRIPWEHGRAAVLLVAASAAYFLVHCLVPAGGLWGLTVAPAAALAALAGALVVTRFARENEAKALREILARAVPKLMRRNS